MSSRDPLSDPAKAIRRVYSYVAYRLGRGADAEDVTSQVIERALRYRSSYDRRRGTADNWLLGIARTCVDDALRERGERFELLDRAASSETLETDTIERLGIAAAVARLDLRDQELVSLRYGADLSTKEIAALFDLTPNAVDVALHRCRARLRDELETAGYPDVRGERAAAHEPVLGSGLAARPRPVPQPVPGRPRG
jgi:RNA polymerase sigma-70 factor (ECF subfamily)